VLHKRADNRPPHNMWPGHDSALQRFSGDRTTAEPSGRRFGETKFLTGLICLFLLLTSLPYLYGRLSCPPEKQFVGLVGWDVPGAYMYFMWEKQGLEGRTLFQDRLTPEKHKPFYFNLEWLLLGRAVNYLNLSLISAFQVERCLTLLAGLVILYYFVGRFFSDVVERRCVFLWILFTSGLGWVFWVIRKATGLSWPIRVWGIEGVNLFGYLINKPHVIRSLALVCLSYAFLLQGEQRGRVGYFILAGVTICFQGFIRPYDLPAAFVLLAIFPLLITIRERTIDWLRVRNYLIAALTALPIVLYYVFLRSSILREVFEGVSFEAFTPLEMLIWLGIPLLLAFCGFDGLKSFKDWDKPKLFLYLWALIVFALIYAYPIIPWGMESAGLCYIVAPVLAGRVVYGRFIPALATTELGRRLTSRFKLDRRRWTVLVSFIAILLCLPSNLILYGKLFANLAAHSRPYYIPIEVADAFSWLAHNASTQNVVLSDAQNGYHLPVDASVTAFIGHGHFTIDYAGKRQLLARFFDSKEPDEFRQELLHKYAVAYVFYSDLERKLGDFDPSAASYLRPVYSNSLVTIYEVPGAMQIHMD